MVSAQLRDVGVIAYCEAGPQIGMGHMVRLGTLLRHLPAELDIICCVDRDLARPYFPVRSKFRSPGRSSVIRQLKDSLQRHALTVLLLDLKEHHMSCHKALTLVIDDYGGRAISGDVVVNQSDFLGDTSYPSLPGHALVLRGIEFTILRQPFSAVEPKLDRTRIGFVSGSGRKSFAWAREIVRKFDPNGLPEVQMVISATQPDASELIAEGRRRSLSVMTGLTAEEMSSFYRDKAACVMTAGTAMFEAMATGTPVVCFPILDDMLKQTTWLADRKSIIALPRSSASASQVRKFILDIFGDRNALTDVGETGRSLVDGYGADRVAMVITSIIKRCLSGHSIPDAVRIERMD